MIQMKKPIFKPWITLLIFNLFPFLFFYSLGLKFEFTITNGFLYLLANAIGFITYYLPYRERLKKYTSEMNRLNLEKENMRKFLERKGTRFEEI